MFLPLQQCYYKHDHNAKIFLCRFQGSGPGLILSNPFPQLLYVVLTGLFEGFISFNIEMRKSKFLEIDHLPQIVDFKEGKIQAMLGSRVHGSFTTVKK